MIKKLWLSPGTNMNTLKTIHKEPILNKRVEVYPMKLVNGNFLGNDNGDTVELPFSQLYPGSAYAAI